LEQTEPTVDAALGRRPILLADDGRNVPASADDQRRVDRHQGSEFSQFASVHQRVGRRGRLRMVAASLMIAASLKARGDEGREMACEGEARQGKPNAVLAVDCCKL